jgi:RNase P subunit RPR2
MAKIIKVADMREFEAQLIKEEITYTRMLELIEAKVLEQCFLKDDLLAEIDKRIGVSEKREQIFSVTSNKASALSERVRQLLFKNIKLWVLAYKPASNYKNIKSELSEAARNVGQYENMANEMRAAQSKPSSIECLSCGHKWNIELPALFKETFCPKCGA